MERKPNFRQVFREYAETRGADLARLSAPQISALMTRCYVEKIIRPTRPGLLPDDEEDIETCYVDGAGDRGADFVFRSDAGVVLVIQAKYRNAEKFEKLEDIEYFCGVLRRHHPKSGETLPKSRMAIEAFADVDWEKDNFELQYITLGKVQQDHRRWAEDLLDESILPAVRGIDDRVQISILAEPELKELVGEAVTAGQFLHDTIDVQFMKPADGGPWIVHENEAGARSYIGLISAAQLRRLYEPVRHRNRLFSMNIRNYIGETSTNRAIESTAEHDAANFFFFNNGISAVSTGVVADARTCTLRCERFSIVNGAQTVRSLVRAHKRTSEKVAPACVALRVSEVSLSDDDFLVNVTRYNNTQNAIKISDFRSNDAVQVSLAARFASLPTRGGKKFVYKNKRSETPRGAIPIGMEEFAKTIFSFRFGPPDVFGGTSYLFDTSASGGYMRLFGDEGEVWNHVSKDNFEEMAGTWLICEQIRAVLRGEKAAMEAKEVERATQPLVVKDALERRWMVFFAVGEYARAKYAKEQASLAGALRKLSHPEWTERSGHESEAVAKYTRAACELLVRLYRAALKDPTFVHRNWFRSANTIREIEAEVAGSETLLDFLPPLRK